MRKLTEKLPDCPICKGVREFIPQGDMVVCRACGCAFYVDVMPCLIKEDQSPAPKGEEGQG